MKLPIRLLDYLKEKEILSKAAIILKSEDKRVLSDFQMNGIESPDQMGISDLGKGKLLESIAPFLDQAISQSSVDVILPNIETLPGVYLDAHMIHGDEDDLWIVIVEKGEAARELQKIVQKSNELELQKQQLHSRKKETGFQILSSFDYAVFRYIGPNKFALLNSPPEWVTRFLAMLGFKKDAIDLASHFAYLESFLVEAMEFWQSDQEGKLKSSLWTETDTWGKDYYLEAYALKLDQTRLIVIEPKDIDVSEKQAIIQKAREKSLDYERVVKEEEALQKLVDLKDQFVMIVSHDLRSPVSTALGFFNLLLDDDEFIDCNSEKHIRYLRIIYNEIENLLNYNDKVYSWINLELGNIKLELVQINLSELVDHSLNAFEAKAAAKNIELEATVDDRITIEVDESLFRNVMYNLLGNAIKFTQPGGMIHVSGAEKDQQISIRIKDSGIGMTDAIKNEIFSNYSTKHSKGTAGESGTGLGLGICKKIVDAHGFNISVESEVGKGTEFIIEI
ncbi:HAMP domain-containing histidine kinase [bacterium]|nr:HAMP domain-containing histidine kinase [bacterium]